MGSLWLIAVVIVVYAGSFSSGFTELDDTIFINERQDYNSDISNLGTSFERGVFDATKDTYYRPLLLDSFVLNHQISGTSIKGYHVVNILLHIIAVLLLFALLKRTGIVPLHAFLLSILFAVHPVLSQAVSWIPGRNDSLLGIFCFAFMLLSIRYLQSGKWIFALCQFIFLLAALFTKETAVFIPPAFFLLLLLLPNLTWRHKRNIILYVTWVVAVIIWYVMRSNATLQNEPLDAAEMVKTFFGRCLISVQYLGKIILPFNLSVFPMMEETSYIFGIAALLLLGLLIYFSKERNNKIILAGFGWFLLMLFPAFLLPASLNNQDFEHRLYVPLFGILLVLGQTALFKNLKTTPTILTVISICIVFSIINIRHQQNFKDPVTFWTSAVHSTPNSAYATMMLAARIDETDPAGADSLLLKAWQLNPTEKYVNYYLGKMYIDKDSFRLAEQYLLAELDISAYYETYFHLSRIEFEKNNIEGSIRYMEKYLEADPGDEQAMNNYILLLVQSGQVEKAKAYVRQKQKEGFVFPSDLPDIVK